MNKIVGFLVFDAVAIGMYFVCANSHIDIFPCETAQPARITGDMRGDPPLQVESGTCSLLAHNRGRGPDGSYEKLTTVGWASLIAMCVAAGALAGGIATVVTRKR